MKTQLLKALFAGCLLCIVNIVAAQEVTWNTTTQFYYNPFDDGNIGANVSYLVSGTANRTIAVGPTTTTQFNGTQALTSQNNVNVKNNIYGSILGPTDRDLNSYDYEWTFLYKNNSNTNPVESYNNGSATNSLVNAGPTSGNGAWKYWFNASKFDNTATDITGFYITHVGGNMIFRYRGSENDIQSLITFPVSNNVIYAIKVQRLKNGRWIVYANPVSTNAEGITYVGQTDQGAINNYGYTVLECTDLRASGNNFYWDNLKMYTRRISFSSINSATNGITQSPLLAGQANVVLYGLQMYIRGYYPIYDINMSPTSASASLNAYLTNGRLYRSIDDFYTTPADNTLLKNPVYDMSSSVQSGPLNGTTGDIYSTSGSTDGSLTRVADYYLVVDVLSNLNNGHAPTGTIQFTGPTQVRTADYQTTISYTNNGATGNNVISFTNTINAPTASGTATLCGAGTTPLSASGGSPAGGTYSWYTAATGGTLLQSSTSASYTPFVGGTTTFYVQYTVGSISSTRSSVTITVNPKVSSSINSPMLSYPFEAGSLTDWSGLSNNGTLQGSPSPTLVADRNGLASSAYSFSGTNASPQYISTSYNYNPNPPLVFSYSIWFKTSTPGGKLIGFGGNATGSNATQDRNLYMGSTGALYYGVYNGGTQYTNTSLTVSYADGLWHHAIVTDGPTGGMKIYVDGALQATNPTYTVPQGNTGYWRIGGDSLNGWPDAPSNWYFNGVLDDVAIYNHELTASEIVSNDNNLYKFSANYCANNTLVATAQNLPGASYAWVDNANTTITKTGASASFPSATTTNYTLTSTYGTCSNAAIVTPTMLTYTWTGAAGTTVVSTAANWTNTSTGIASVAPALDGTESIVIGSAATNFYPLLTANKSAYTLTINSGGKLDLGGLTLNVGCNIFNSAGGILAYDNNYASAITWNGSGANVNQSFTGSSTAAFSELGNMTVSNTASGGNVTISSGKLNLYNVLTLTNGKLVVSSPATLTLKSLATQSATVAAIPSGLSITGNVSVERYIAGGAANKRGYRLLTSPVNNGSGVFSLNYLKNTAYVTGTTTTSGGFDLAPVNNPTIYLFRENKALSNVSFTSGNYRGVNNITTDPIYSFDGESSTYTIPVGNGFLFFFRGDRAIAPITTEAVASYIPTAATFTATGTLNTGNITVKHWYDQSQSLLFTSTPGSTVQGYNLVGNPYASTINIEKFNRQSTQAKSSIYGFGFPSEVYPTSGTLSAPLKIWMFNPTNKQYEAYEQNKTTTVDTTNVNPSLIRTGSATNMIASGQGFLIRATAAGQTLTFRESSKSNVQPTNATLAAILTTPNKPVVMASTSASFAAQEPMASGGIQTEAVLKFRLLKDTVNTDDIVIALDQNIDSKFNKDKDAEDLGGSGALVSLSALTSDSLKMSIHRRAYPQKLQQIIPITTDATTSGLYQLSLIVQSEVPAIYDVWLKDALLKDSLDIKHNPTYSFTIDKGNAASFGAKRFQVVIRENPALMVHLLDFKASKVTTGANTSWTVENEANYTTFTVQRSVDNGVNWADLQVIQSTAAGQYSFVDVAPANGQNIYRLKQTDLNNDVTFSKQAALMYSNTNTTVATKVLTVYPNPAREVINVNIAQTAPSSDYNIQITNSSGMVLKTVNIAKINWQNNVGAFLPGTYILKVVDNKTQSLIGITKFIKL